MGTAWVHTVRRAARNRHVDTALALAASVATFAELLASSGRAIGYGAFLAIAAVLSLCIGIPLAWRRRAPLTAFGVTLSASVGGAVLAHALFTHPQRGNGVLTPFLAVLLVAFSLGAYGRKAQYRWAAAVAAVALGLDVGVTAATNSGFDFGFWVATAIFWLLGRLFRARLNRVSELEDYTELLREQQEAAARLAVEQERARIARELHDVVAHSVSLMVIQAGAAGHTLHADDADTAEALSAIETTGRQALVELRRLLGILRDADELPSLAPMPGLAQLEPLARQIRDAGLPVELHTEGQPVPLPLGIDLAVYRIVQEALTNSLKHSGRANAHVVLRFRSHEVEVEVTDDGTAAAESLGGAGYGLVGIRERVALYGGAMSAGPCAGHGFRVSARLPLAGNGTT